MQYVLNETRQYVIVNDMENLEKNKEKSMQFASRICTVKGSLILIK